MPSITVAVGTLAVVVAVLAVAQPAQPFAAHAELAPTGCTQAVSGSILTLRGCVASAPFVGTARGRLDIAYDARVDIARGGGSQQGTLTLRGPSPGDRVVLRFRGTVTIATGRSRGTWRAVERVGAFAKTVPRTGTYSSTTPDQGAHVSFDVRG